MAPGEELTCFTCCARSRQASAARSWRAISAGRSIAFDLFILAFVMDDIADEFGIRRAPAHRQSDEGTRQIWVRELAELSEWPRNRSPGILGIRSAGTG
jgi:hypothetical protein